MVRGGARWIRWLGFLSFQRLLRLPKIESLASANVQVGLVMHFVAEMFVELPGGQRHTQRYRLMTLRLRAGFQLVHYRFSMPSALCRWVDENRVDFVSNDGSRGYCFADSLHDENVALFGTFQYTARRMKILEKLNGS